MSLYTCEHDDSVVVYSSRHCPLCKAIEDIKDQQGEITALENEIQTLKETKE